MRRVGVCVALSISGSLLASEPSPIEALRAGSNGITCLLNQAPFFSGARQFKPACWAGVSAATYVPVMVKVGELLSKGQSVESIRSSIADGFARGQFHAPTTGGVAYLLAGDLELDLKSGDVRRQAFAGALHVRRDWRHHRATWYHTSRARAACRPAPPDRRQG